MKLSIRKISISLLFCLIFIVSVSFNVFAESAEVIYSGQRYSLNIKGEHNYELDENSVVSVEEWNGAIVNYYCGKFQECEENKFENKNIIDNITFIYDGDESSKEESPITSKGCFS